MTFGLDFAIMCFNPDTCPLKYQDFLVGENSQYMRKILITIFILSLTLISPATAGQIETSQNRELIQPAIKVKPADERTRILADYFAKYNSPFENHAQDFIDAADTYGVDWKLVPAIAGVESTFGKNSYGYNAWGWGIYGNQALNFASWRTGIYTVTGGLKENYINNGLTEPLAMNRAYAASPTWGTRVNYFIRDLSYFSNNYSRDVDSGVIKIKEAAESGELVSEN